MKNSKKDIFMVDGLPGLTSDRANKYVLNDSEILGFIISTILPQYQFKDPEKEIQRRTTEVILKNNIKKVIFDSLCWFINKDNEETKVMVGIEMQNSKMTEGKLQSRLEVYDSYLRVDNNTNEKDKIHKNHIIMFINFKGMENIPCVINMYNLDPIFQQIFNFSDTYTKNKVTLININSNEIYQSSFNEKLKNLCCIIKGENYQTYIRIEGVIGKMIKKAEQYKNFVFPTAMEIWKENFFEEGKLQGLEEGKLQGLEEGKLQGIEEGKIQGIEEGKLQGKLQTVKAMKEDGLSLEKISQYTGLPLEKIKKI